MQPKEQVNYMKKIGWKIAFLAVILLGVFVTYKLAIFYIPFLIAIVVATILEPTIQFFMKKMKLKRKAASIFALLLLTILIGIILTFTISKIMTESTSLLANLNQYFRQTYDWGMGIIADIQEGRIEISDEMVKLAQDSLGGVLNTVQEFLIHFFNGLVGIVTSVPTMVTYIFITILAIVFTCFDREYVIHQFKKHVPAVWIQKAKRIVKETCSVGWNYIKAEAKLSFICFLLVLIGLTIMNFFIDVQYPIIMAILIGVVDLLPLFGAGAVMLPWAGYLFITGNMPLAIGILIVWGVWAILKNLLEPKMVSKQMGLNPIFTLFGMYTGFRIFGVLGLMLGPIILIILKNIFKELVDKGILKSFFELE